MCLVIPAMGYQKELIYSFRRQKLQKKYQGVRGGGGPGCTAPLHEEAIDATIETLEIEKVEQEPLYSAQPLTTIGLQLRDGGGGGCLFKKLIYFDLFRFREGCIYLDIMYRWEGWI